ncbi:uncharacterized protein ARB_04471 [Trichophyton benhamiae CBS 112371]|uniref:Uncharacterized protein n=1 Tax=Arthroderma benhamiae (strain ATCC MYA-4681 / CBS 112371) TaxID=663331 RepID=D4AJM1_ARTBC|nr:uncharacterized protein ARB_04471 [Trichophyton benhamiae CBS 112371]EFE36944.1 hypothetical protein ARB_04471 [Trichophyton benhamiae CBS 112371]
MLTRGAEPSTLKRLLDERKKKARALIIVGWLTISLQVQWILLPSHDHARRHLGKLAEAKQERRQQQQQQKKKKKKKREEY